MPKFQLLKDNELPVKMLDGRHVHQLTFSAKNAKKTDVEKYINSLGTKIKGNLKGNYSIQTVADTDFRPLRSKQTPLGQKFKLFDPQDTDTNGMITTMEKAGYSEDHDFDVDKFSLFLTPMEKS